MASKACIFSMVMLVVGMSLVDLANSRRLTRDVGQNSPSAPVGKCPRGVTFKVECNTCSCTPETGLLQCTKVDCRHVSKSSSETTNTADGGPNNPNRVTENCPLGEMYMEDCNRCGCDLQTGNSWCTRIGCFNDDNGNVGRNSDKCPLGVSYTSDCNTCSCSLETGLSRCTLLLCNNSFSDEDDY